MLTYHRSKNVPHQFFFFEGNWYIQRAVVVGCGGAKTTDERYVCTPYIRIGSRQALALKSLFVFMILNYV